MEQPDIGPRIRAAEAFGGFAGRQALADAIESSPSTLQRIESGARTPKRAELLAIADATGVPMWFLERGWDGWQEKVVDKLGRKALDDIESGDAGKRRHG